MRIEAEIKVETSSLVLVSIDCHTDLPLSISWNLNGSQFATTCKDKTLRVINPRNGKVIAEKEKAHEGNKSSKCIFLKTGKVFTLGFSKRCDRQYALWDPVSPCSYSRLIFLSRKAWTKLLLTRKSTKRPVFYSHFTTPSRILFTSLEKVTHPSGNLKGFLVMFSSHDDFQIL